MNLLSVENLAKRFGERELFASINFGIDQGKKLALVAKNGEGKSTLLEILAGNMTADEGNVVFRKGIKVGYLKQNEDFSRFKTLKEFLFGIENKYSDALTAYEEAMKNPHNSNELEQALEMMNHSGAWDYQNKTEQLLSLFKLDELGDDQLLNQLSGGQTKRLALIKLILEEPDLYILDEPTNHLDIEMIEWLEEYFSGEQISLFMVTHDRYFLNRVCNEIVEIEEGVFSKYQGDYEYYLEKKAEREEIFASEVSKAKNIYRKEVEWIRRMPKARGTKSKARISDFSEVEKNAKRRINKDHLQLEIKSERLGGKILELHHVRKSFDNKKIIDDFSYVFKQGDKIGIAGRNGVGKTTFLNLIMGMDEVDGGKIVKGDTVQFGYYTQKGMKIDESKRIIEAVKEIAEVIPLTKGNKITASQLLERFLFPPKQQYTPISKLSGGEKKRLFLLRLLMANPNFLILDEPTNDLDVKTIAILEEFLNDFVGCLLIVSHDRAFMDNLSQHIFHFKGDGEIKDFNGSYSDLIEIQKTENSKPKEEIKVEVKKESVQKEKLNYNERKEFNRLELEITKTEVKIAQINEEMFSSVLTSEELEFKSKELEDLLQILDEKTERWMTLSERA